jgi:hypothetical protein
MVLPLVFISVYLLATQWRWPRKGIVHVPVWAPLSSPLPRDGARVPQGWQRVRPLWWWRVHGSWHTGCFSTDTYRMVGYADGVGHQLPMGSGFISNILTASTLQYTTGLRRSLTSSLLKISTSTTNRFRHWRSQIGHNFSFVTNL